MKQKNSKILNEFVSLTPGTRAVSALPGDSSFHCPGEEKENKSSPRAVLLNLHLGMVVTQSSKEHIVIYLLAEM